MNDNATKQDRFAELMKMALSPVDKSSDMSQLPLDVCDELDSLAADIGGRFETIIDERGTKKKCYWICNNHFSCDPANPPPNCGCHMVCF